MYGIPNFCEEDTHESVLEMFTREAKVAALGGTKNTVRMSSRVAVNVGMAHNSHTEDPQVVFRGSAANFGAKASIWSLEVFENVKTKSFVCNIKMSN